MLNYQRVFVKHGNILFDQFLPPPRFGIDPPIFDQYALVCSFLPRIVFQVCYFVQFMCYLRNPPMRWYAMMKPTDFDATISDELALYQGTPPGQESSICKVAHFAWYQAGKMGKARDISQVLRRNWGFWGKASRMGWVMSSRNTCSTPRSWPFCPRGTSSCHDALQHASKHNQILWPPSLKHFPMARIL